MILVTLQPHSFESNRHGWAATVSMPPLLVMQPASFLPQSSMILGAGCLFLLSPLLAAITRPPANSANLSFPKYSSFESLSEYAI